MFSPAAFSLSLSLSLIQVHMLIAMLYSVVIFGLGLSKYFKIGEADASGDSATRRLSLELSSKRLSRAIVARAIRGESTNGEGDEVYVRM